jgi:hypothetical protein
MDCGWYENQTARIRAIADAIVRCGCREICKPCNDRAFDLVRAQMSLNVRRANDLIRKSKPEL